MATTRQRANDKYNKKAYKRFDARLKPKLFQELEDLREELKLSKPELLAMLLDVYKQTK